MLQDSGITAYSLGIEPRHEIEGNAFCARVLPGCVPELSHQKRPDWHLDQSDAIHLLGPGDRYGEVFGLYPMTGP